MNRLEQANHILYNLGLLNELNTCGKSHLIGSVKMNLMAWNDLDIDVENDSMSLEKLHQLTKYILNNFNPIWYEANEEINEQGNRVWFQVFEFYLDNDLWNVDIWFLDKDTIENAEKYCDAISAKVKENEKLRAAIIDIKQELNKRNLYSFWVKDYFIPNAVEYGCKTIYFIIDKSNSLADELKGQEEDSKDKISFKYIYDLTQITQE